MTDYVLVYAFTVDSKLRYVPLVKKNKPEFLKGVLNLVGGKIEEGETPVQAGIRELLEETGLEEIQVYDPMCYYPAERMGIIQGKLGTVYCIKVPVCYRQELKPGEEETEEVKWYPITEIFSNKLLMPNLRLIIPLMENKAKNWVITDSNDTCWRNDKEHKLTLSFRNIPDHPVDVWVKAMGYFEKEEEE
jgi:8-oxo-dGTP pyrophosphatase MutT (NUDIX family)